MTNVKILKEPENEGVRLECSENGGCIFLTHQELPDVIKLLKAYLETHYEEVELRALLEQCANGELALECKTVNLPASSCALILKMIDDNDE